MEYKRAYKRRAYWRRWLADKQKTGRYRRRTDKLEKHKGDEWTYSRHTDVQETDGHEGDIRTYRKHTEIYDSNIIY